MIVYTATDGRKLAPNKAWPGVRMICFSETRPPPPWEWLPLKRTSDDPARNAKAPRILPWDWLPDWEHCLWIDATMELIRDPRDLPDYEFAACAHRDRDCIYDEAEECIRLKKDDPATIRQQMHHYFFEHPRRWGLWETGLMLRTNTARNARICAAWWAEIVNCSRRDQLSLPVVARRHDLTIESLGRIDDNPWVRYHRKLNRAVA